MLIFSPHMMKYIWYLPKKVNFLFILYSKEIEKAQPNFNLGRFSFDLTFSVCLLGITSDIFIHILDSKRNAYFQYPFNTRNTYKILP